MPSNNAETAISRMQNRIPGSLYEVAWQYSLLDWYSSKQSPALDFQLAPDHLAYLTPSAKNSLFGEADSLVVVHADLSDPESPALRSDTDGGPVELTTYTEDDRFRVGHAYPEDKTSNMTDYSITTHKSADAHHIAGLRDDAYWTNNIRDRFTDWAQSEFAQEVRNEVEDSDRAILEALATLGDDEDAMEDLSEAFLELVSDEEEEVEALITVRVKLPDSDEWKFPGEVPVLNEVMRAKKADRLQSISVDDASGEGTGYVSNDDGRVTGGSSGLFGMYGKKQREHFVDLDTEGSSAWRARPLEFDTAAAIASAGSLFGDFYRGLGSSRRLYILPYLAARRDDVDDETFEWFYDRVYTRLRDAEGGSDGSFDETVETLFAEAYRVDNESAPAEVTEDDSDIRFSDRSTAAWNDVRFAVVHQVSGNPDRVFFDTLDGVSPAVPLENAHNRVTKAPVFTSDGIFHDNPNPESSPILGRNLHLVRYILYGGYFRRTTEPTRSSREASETPGAGDIDDSRMQRVRNLLTGTRIDAKALLEEYIHQLVQDQNDQFGNDNGYISFPKRSVVEQYAQIHALQASEVLDTDETIQFIHTHMPDEFEDRSARLDEFISSHDALSGDPEQAVFTLGGLIGRISAYQSYENVSSTLIRRYPVDYLTKQTIKEVTKEVLQMNNSYAEAEESRSYRTNARYTDRLADTMLAADPQSWRLNESELQWLYSLGIAYGLSDSSLYEEEEETEEAPESSA
ncbi:MULTISPECIES: TM1802 family CRISPR-associated protein [Haloferacaceae]|uniref:TM1802 family CRISPR-associated protein n=1 Tax=Halorubrum glutamatedens TaxID=2707018 RepID=A0ABD5QU40_9EURY|nr:TM1802 family CRISPR-associated protein [Halobellus captivus]